MRSWSIIYISLSLREDRQSRRKERESKKKKQPTKRLKKEIDRMRPASEKGEEKD